MSDNIIITSTNQLSEYAKTQIAINNYIKNYENYYNNKLINTYKPHVKLTKDLHTALESNKYVFLAGLQGVGKTITSNIEVINNYRNGIFISNTHELNDEINMSLMYNRKLKINNDPSIVNLFGKDFNKISKKLQRERGYPPCMCNFWEDTEYYLKKLNYFPNEWCSYPEGIKKDELDNLTENELINLTLENKKSHCPFIYECKHKKMIKTALNSLERKGYENIHIIWLMVKAYLDTNMIDAFLKVDKPVGIIDENILGLCYDQVSLNAYSIRKFNSLADRMSKFDRSLREIYLTLKPIFRLIDNLITYDREVEVNKRAKQITKKIEEFLQSYKINDILGWNNKFKKVALEHSKQIKKTYNIMDLIIKILQSNKDNIEEFENNLTMDRDSPNISLFISKIQHIREIVQKFYKLIFTDALLPTVIIETTQLLGIKDNYKLLYDKNRKAQWKEVKVLKLNSQKGKYTKNTLLNIDHSGLSNSFDKLINLSKQIIEFEAERDRKTGLLGSMKLFQYNEFNTNIKKELTPIIKKYNMNVKYDHYGNAEGKNAYSNVDWIILFGGYNTPERVRGIESFILTISTDKLEHIRGPGTLIQYAHRGRPLLRPNEVSLYSLTNDIRGCFEQEENFKNIPQIEYKQMLRFINSYDGATTGQIMEFLNKPRQSTLNILHILTLKGILRKGKRVIGRSRPTGVWYLNQ